MKNKITTWRNSELSMLRRFFIVAVLLEIVWSFATIIVSLSTFLVYTRVFNQPLTATVAFTAVALFNSLKVPLDSYPEVLAKLIECHVSYGRIKSFLEEPELRNYVTTSPDGKAVGFKNAFLSWQDNYTDSELDGSILEDLDLFFPHGKLSVITGKTGSGKTTLLLSLLGELHLVSGEVFFPNHKKSGKRFAYVSQQAWIQNATVRDNILFGLPMDPVRYNEVIKVCALERDLQLLEGGDLTEIGEKGANLSGGQKQRISLARAVYSDADIFLLDDPLSAVDAPTGKHLFEQCLLGELMSNKTILLVTHAVSLTLSRAEFAVVLKRGKVVAQGTAEQVMRRAERLGLEIFKDISQTESDIVTQQVNEPKSVCSQKLHSIQDAEEVEVEFMENQEFKKKNDVPFSITTQETKTTGSVSLSVYSGYIKAIGSPFTVVIFFLLMILARLLLTLKDYSLTLWTRAVDAGNSELTFHYMYRYALVSATVALVIAFSYAAGYSAALSASRKLHKRLLQRILNAPIHFFDSTPVGRIVNRFSTDTNNIDQALVKVFRSYVDVILNIVTVIISITTVTPIFAVIVLPVGRFAFVVDSRIWH
jgi:ABC-type multidrug transport system fused ATPase/permease subunit